jgi:hypothetical protein
MRKLDDAEIYLLDFEDPDTPQTAGSTHIGIFLAWALLRGLGSPQHIQFDFGRLRKREITGATFLDRYCASKLIDSSDLNPMGAAFAGWYYERYLSDYLQVFGLDPDGALDQLAQVSDDWASYDRVAVVLEERLREWLAANAIAPAAIVPPTLPEEPTGADGQRSFAAGERVRHSRFGPGTVLACTIEAGAERALVAFDSGEEKWLALAFARLERIG